MSTLNTPKVTETLNTLHELASHDHKTGLPGNNATRFMAITEDQGKFLNFLVTLTKTKNIVEFGTSFGISTIYLAAAAKDTGGTVTTTEMEASKVTTAQNNIDNAGVGDVVEILPGDATQTLLAYNKKVDFLFLDGAKELYIPVFDLLYAKLSSNAVVVADNIDKPETRPFVDYIQAKSEFICIQLFEGRMLVAYKK